MGAAETPLNDILAQLRERVEAWSREAAAARAALAEEVAAARRELEAETVGLLAAANAAAEDDPAAALREAVEALQGQLSSAQGQVAAAQGEVNNLRTALDTAHEESAGLRARIEHLEAERGADTSGQVIAELEAALEAARGEAAAAQSDAHAARAALEEKSAAMMALEAALRQKDAALAAAQAEIVRITGDAARAEAARALVESDIPAFDKGGQRRRMGTILVEAGVLTQEQLDEALAEQAADPHRRFGTIVVERGYTTEEAVARILAAQLRLPFAPLSPGTYDLSAARLISAHLARLHKAVPIRQEPGVLTVAMANPLDLIAIEDIEIASRCRVEPVVATRSAIDALLALAS